MTCRGVRRRLPLYAGGDLSPRRAAKMASHIESCPVCRRELNALLRARRSGLAYQRATRISWDEIAWDRAVQTAVAGGISRPRRFFLHPLRPAPGLVLTALAALALVVVLFRSGTGPADSGRVAAAEKAPDMLAVTFVSGDSGLKVKWFFNRKFDLEEKIP
jgi:anti-sigma factor RsiW